MRLGIVARRESPRAASLADEITRAVRPESEVLIDETTAASLETTGVPPTEMRVCDLVVSIGGDGTFLYAAREIEETPIMGVNLGEVGFLNATPPEDAVEAVERTIEEIETGRLTTRERQRLSAGSTDETEGSWILPPALNEVVVMGQQRGHGNGCDIEVRIDGSLYTGGHADGVLIATPTGSTAYNLSERGPLIHPDATGMVINEMCPMEGMPPLIVDAESDVTVRVSESEQAVVVADGRIRQPVCPPTKITVSSASPVHVAGPDIDFFTSLGKLE